MPSFLITNLLIFIPNSITLDGQPVAAAGTDRAVAFQKPALLPWRTALNNVAYPLRLRRHRVDRGDRARHGLHLHGGPPVIWRPAQLDDAHVRDGGWQRQLGGDLGGRTLGLVGLGRQGARVARVAHAFDMNVIAWSPHLTKERAAEHGAECVTKHEEL
jgi:D-isomer specific 2-hydroxyacid dehydrogenase-like protein